MEQNDSHTVTISDVASMAGVSIKTVSRVANGEANVRPATRTRVQQVIDVLGYSANPYARYLGSLSRKARVSAKESGESAGPAG